MSLYKQITSKGRKHGKCAGPSKKRQKQLSKAEHKKQIWLREKRKRNKEISELFK